MPLNLLPKGAHADYVVSGSWSKSAAEEAANFGNINVVDAIESSNGQKVVINSNKWQLSGDAAYVHYCPNETVDGIEMFDIPDTGDVPLVADMSSTILSHQIDVSKFGLIYAGAQKNIGPSGLTVVIVRDDLLGNADKATPAIMNYDVLAKTDSMHNTPPTYAWYLAGLVFEWLKSLGGVAAMEQVNAKKAELLYQAIDSSALYYNNVDAQNRSRMNVPFGLKTKR